MRISSHTGAHGRLSVREWSAPPGSVLWFPSGKNGPLTQQMLAAGFVLVDEEIRPNEVLDAGRNLIRDLLRGQAVSGLTHYAIGTAGTTPTRAQTPQHLLAEVHRAEITSFSVDVAKLTVEFYVPSSAANGYTLLEAGPFGSGATGTANSGICYARAVHNARVKDASKAFTYSHDLTW